MYWVLIIHPGYGCVSMRSSCGQPVGPVQGISQSLCETTLRNLCRQSIFDSFSPAFTGQEVPFGWALSSKRNNASMSFYLLQYNLSLGNFVSGIDWVVASHLESCLKFHTFGRKPLT